MGTAKGNQPKEKVAKATTTCQPKEARNQTNAQRGAT